MLTDDDTETDLPTFIYKTMADVRAANHSIGNHWFEPDTMRFFKSKISDTLYDGRWFWTSEQGPDEVRRWSIREANPDGTISTVGEFQGYGTAAAAVRAIRNLMAEATREFFDLHVKVIPVTLPPRKDR